MVILGLNFGHDASVVVLRSGRPAAFVLRERHDRIRHAMGLGARHIDRALAAAGVAFHDVDAVAITSTQGKELALFHEGRAALRPGRISGHAAPGAFEQELAAHGKGVASFLGGNLRYYLDNGLTHYRHYLPEYLADPAAIAWHGWLNQFSVVSPWTAEPGLGDLPGLDVRARLRGEEPIGFHYPAVFTFDGVERPAYLLDHHHCHAASSYYQSPHARAVILTHDGYTRPWEDNAGLIFAGLDGWLRALTPHHLYIGPLYDAVGERLNLGQATAAGKLMGLAAWGRPRFHDTRFVGNWPDFVHRFPDAADYREAWWRHCLAGTEDLGRETGAVGDPDRITDPVNADIAASTQALTEDTMVAAAHAARRMMAANGTPLEALCLSGGTALNCPANTAVAQGSGFAHTFVEPACDDGGLGLGAALLVYHGILEMPWSAAAGLGPSPYQGPPPEPARREAALAPLTAEAGYTVHRGDAALEAAVAVLAGGGVVAWYEGASEMGPRALGHRSLLADPRAAGNWPRVNRIKGREGWRPLAPMVLAGAADTWFAGCPLPAPYMLFTGRVIDGPALPAITHIDGTARVQTVADDSPEAFATVLRRFADCTGVPVLLNTSLNGPGEPIVERPEEAVAFFRAGEEVDGLWLDGVFVRPQRGR